MEHHLNPHLQYNEVLPPDLDGDVVSQYRLLIQYNLRRLSHTGGSELPRQITIPYYKNIFIPTSIASFETIHSIVMDTLSTIDSLVATYDAEMWCIWIRYGNMPIKYTLDCYQLDYYYRKMEVLDDLCKFVPLKKILNVGIRYFMRETNYIDVLTIERHHLAIRAAAFRASEKMPHNFTYLDYLDLIPMPTSIFGPRKWSDTCIHYTQDANSGDIVLNFETIFGDEKSANFIRHEVKDALSVPKLLWKKRMPYIGLMEGTQCNSTESHITQYLFNFYVCHDVCKLM